MLGMLGVARACSRHAARPPLAVARWYTTAEDGTRKVRNIGIIAHIDAGKTTTTERFLFFSQAKSKIGDVDKGTTTTDFMDQERERGITIQSALTNLEWRDHTFEIIDTPGHVDFTMEVERTLRVLDGAVAVFDAVKGVEAQSRTVLLQAKKFNVPFVSYVNKMDRKGANFIAAVDSIQSLIHIPTVPIQCPVVEDTEFNGFVDLLTAEVYRWGRGAEITKTALNDEGESLRAAADAMRARMIDGLSGASDAIADLYLEALDGGDEAAWEAVPQDLLRAELRKHTLARRVTPVICGSSARSIAVQPVLDAVVDYLPAPTDRPPLIAVKPTNHMVSEHYREKDPLAAMVFKIHVQGRDATNASKASLVRVYCGALKTGMKIYNATRDCWQTVRSLSRVNGDNFSIKVDSLGPGDVGCVWGLDQSFTGDTLCAEKRAAFELEGLRFPEPVVSVCVEPHSQKDDKLLQKALEVVKMEDPSIETEINEYGQTVLSGMGSLHLDITRTKLVRGWGMGLDSGPVRVKHKEYLNSSDPIEITHTFLTDPNNESSQACEMTLRYSASRFNEHDVIIDDNNVTMSLNDMVDEEVTKKKLQNKWLPVIRQGVAQSLGGGPIVNAPVHGAKIDVTRFRVFPQAKDDSVMNAADYTVKLLFNEHKSMCILAEPVLRLKVDVFNAKQHLEDIKHDILAYRRGEIIDQQMTPECTVITAIVAVATLNTFAADLLSMTTGEATFSTEFEGFRLARDRSLQDQVIEETY